MRNPAAWNIEGWLGQVGSLSQIVCPPPVERMRSAATRSPPVPPGVWVASARPEVTASWSAPRTSARTSSRYATSPSIGR